MRNTQTWVFNGPLLGVHAEFRVVFTVFAISSEFLLSPIT